MMSLNRIAASTAIRRSGWSVISVTRSGCRQVPRMSPSPRTPRYSGEVAARLTHEPDRRSVDRLATAGAEEPVGGGRSLTPRIRTAAARAGGYGMVTGCLLLDGELGLYAISQG